MNVIVGCIVIEDNKILMVRESKGSSCGKWGFPVGHLEDDETIFEGAIRETFEESGYKVQLKGVLPITETRNKHGKYVLIRFIADVISFVSDYQTDVAEVAWMDFNQVLNLKDEEFRCCKANRKVLEYIEKKQIYPLNFIRGNIFEE